MPSLGLKPTHKPIQNYYAALRQFDDLGVSHEIAGRSAFSSLSASIGERARVRCRSNSLTRRTINPNLADAAVEEMLIQHLLTERLFRTVFNNADFTRRNIIAAEIEKVIDALASQSFSRAEFLKKLDRFYLAIEHIGAIEQAAQKG